MTRCGGAASRNVDAFFREVEIHALKTGRANADLQMVTALGA
jgi:hypothetical protein